MPTETPAKILIVEDQPHWQKLYRIWLKEVGKLTFARNKEEAIRNLKKGHFDVMVLDLGLPDPAHGLETFQYLLSLQLDTKIIVVTGLEDREYALKVQEMGAYAFFKKDSRLRFELPVLVHKAAEMLELERQNRRLTEQISQLGEQYRFLGVSPAAEELRRKAQLLANSEKPILILGPTGVGKSHFARYIHTLSTRARYPLVVINCANIQPQLMEAELFGHTRGAFTGATEARPGKFLQANKGTLVLEEITELTPYLQAKLLNALEEKSFFPLGSNQKVQVDVRIITTTNRDIQEELENGNFREDLYYRINSFIVKIPPLVERPEDIPFLFDHFLKVYSDQLNLALPEVSPDVYDYIQTLPWPGNVRQLQNEVYRLLIHRPLRITVEMFSSENIAPETLEDGKFTAILPLKEVIARYVRQVVDRCRSKKEAAQLLGIDQKTLNKYLQHNPSESR